MQGVSICICSPIRWCSQLWLIMKIKIYHVFFMLEVKIIPLSVHADNKQTRVDKIQMDNFGYLIRWKCDWIINKIYCDATMACLSVQIKLTNYRYDCFIIIIYMSKINITLLSRVIACSAFLTRVRACTSRFELLINLTWNITISVSLGHLWVRELVCTSSVPKY